MYLTLLPLPPLSPCICFYDASLLPESSYFMHLLSLHCMVHVYGTVCPLLLCFMLILPCCCGACCIYVVSQHTELFAFTCFFALNRLGLAPAVLPLCLLLFAGLSRHFGAMSSFRQTNHSDYCPHTLTARRSRACMPCATGPFHCLCIAGVR